MPRVKLYGLILGLAAFVALLLLSPPAGLSLAAWRVAALLALMVIWWFTEVVPLPVTALLPFILLPFLGVASAEEVAKSSASPLLGLVLGGSLIAAATVKSGLHRRLALLAVRFGGDDARRLVLALMIATVALAMWIAPGVLSIFMIEIGQVMIATALASDPRVVSLDRDQRRFACAMIIGIAYAAALGGAATLTANPVNAMAAGMIGRQTGIEVGFAEWMLFGVPVALLGVPLAWAILVHAIFRFNLRLPDRRMLEAAFEVDGDSKTAQRRVLAVGAAAVTGFVTLSWIRQAVPAMTDGAIAVLAGLMLFLIPAGDGTRQPLLSWEDTRGVPWGVLVLISGALALTAGISHTGLAAWMAAPLRHVDGVPLWLALFALVAGAAWLTELMSNFALTAVAVPAALALATALGADPLVFAAGAAIASGAGYMIPGPPWLAMAVTTPPVRAADLLRSGVALIILAPILITAVCLVATALRP